MSTLAVNAVTDANGGNTATINSMTPTADSLQGFRNRIINGDMRIDQRNAGASVTPTDGSIYTLDRFRTFTSVGSKLSVQQVTDAPTGFSHSAKITVASSYSPSSSEQFLFGTTLEANNVGDFAFGTAQAKSVTLSFWVKSSVTGTYYASYTNNAVSRSFVSSFTINFADTWEYKAITIPGDTSGTWDNYGTGRNCFLQVGLGCGSNFHTTAGSWQAGNYRQVSGSTNFVSQANGSTFYITGVQLEVGSVATPFERRPYGTEFMLCQRYYETWGGETLYQSFGIADAVNTTGAYSVLQYLVPKRVAPTISISSASDFHTIRSALAFTSLTFGQIATTQTFSTINVASGMVAGQAYTWRANNTLSARINFSAEL